MKGDNSVEDGKLSVPLAGTGSSSEWGHFSFGNSPILSELYILTWRREDTGI